MPNYKIAWDEEFPDGFLAYYGTRHMPKDYHKRISVLAAIKGTSFEYQLVKCIGKGLEEEEVAAFMPEIKEKE